MAAGRRLLRTVIDCAVMIRKVPKASNFMSPRLHDPYRWDVDQLRVFHQSGDEILGIQVGRHRPTQSKDQNIGIRTDGLVDKISTYTFNPRGCSHIFAQ